MPRARVLALVEATAVRQGELPRNESVPSLLHEDLPAEHEFQLEGVLKMTIVMARHAGVDYLGLHWPRSTHGLAENQALDEGTELPRTCLSRVASCAETWHDTLASRVATCVGRTFVPVTGRVASSPITSTMRPRCEDE